MARSNNRRNKPKVQQGSSQIPSSGAGGKPKKAIPAKAKKSIPAKSKAFGNKKKAPAFARNGDQPPGLKQGKQHRFQAKERAGGAKKGGRQQEFRFHVLSIGPPSFSYQKAPWKSSTTERPSTINNAETESSGTASFDSTKLQSPLLSARDQSGSRTGSSSNGNRSRSICNRLSLGPLPTEGIPAQLLDCLDLELEQFGDFVRLTPLEVQARNRVVGAVQKAAAQQYAGAQVEPFGYVAIVNSN
jgi:hypothetical protein